MPIYAIASGKGGVGKTVFTLNAGAALSAMGLKTLIIDCDIGMADLGQIVDVSSKDEHYLHEVLAGDVSIQDAINHTSFGMDVVLSGVSIAGFLRADMEKLGEVIEDVVDSYDFILLDTATGIQESLSPLSVCDEVILIVNPEFPSIVDAQKVRLIAEDMGRHVKGVVINRVRDIKGELSANNVEELLELTVLGVIPEDKNMIKALISKVPIVIKLPNSPASKEINEIAGKIAGKKEEKERESKKKRIKLFPLKRVQERKEKGEEQTENEEKRKTVI